MPEVFAVLLKLVKKFYHKHKKSPILFYKKAADYLLLEVKRLAALLGRGNSFNAKGKVYKVKNPYRQQNNSAYGNTAHH